MPTLTELKARKAARDAERASVRPLILKAAEEEGELLEEQEISERADALIARRKVQEAIQSGKADKQAMTIQEKLEAERKQRAVEMKAASEAREKKVREEKAQREKEREQQRTARIQQLRQEKAAEIALAERETGAKYTDEALLETYGLVRSAFDYTPKESLEEFEARRATEETERKKKHAAALALRQEEEKENQKSSLREYFQYRLSKPGLTIKEQQKLQARMIALGYA